MIGVIYENRPNVTSDAAGLCLKAGNAAFLRGSASALASNQAIVAHPAACRGEGGPARGRRGPGGGHLARDRGRLHAPAGSHRLPHPSWRPGPDRLAPGERHRPVRARRGRQLPRLRRCGGRSLHGAGHRGQRQDAPLRGVQRGRDDPGPCRRGRRVPAADGAGPGGGRRGAAGRRTGAGRRARGRRGQRGATSPPSSWGPTVAVGVVDDLDGGDRPHRPLQLRAIPRRS